MDIEMPLMDGIEATRRIVAELPAIKVIGLSMNRDKFRISQALESGASGFVLKGSAFDELHRAIQTVLHEKTIFLSAGIRDMLSDT
jgi:DNA-binding NarL/FixJ family response regulator